MYRDTLHYTPARYLADNLGSRLHHFLGPRVHLADTLLHGKAQPPRVMLREAGGREANLLPLHTRSLRAHHLDRLVPNLSEVHLEDAPQARVHVTVVISHSDDIVRLAQSKREGRQPSIGPQQRIQALLRPGLRISEEADPQPSCSVEAEQGLCELLEALGPSMRNEVLHRHA